MLLFLKHENERNKGFKAKYRFLLPLVFLFLFFSLQINSLIEWKILYETNFKPFITQFFFMIGKKSPFSRHNSLFFKCISRKYMLFSSLFHFFFNYLKSLIFFFFIKLSLKKFWRFFVICLKEFRGINESNRERYSQNDGTHVLVI